MHYKTFNKLTRLARWGLLFINLHLAIYLIANIAIFIEYKASYIDAMQSLTNEVQTNDKLTRELLTCKKYTH